MKKLFAILLIFTAVLFSSCSLYGPPVLEEDQYEIVEILDIGRNGYGKIMGYGVIIKYDHDLYYGRLDKNKTLYYINFKKLNLIEKE